MSSEDESELEDNINQKSKFQKKEKEEEDENSNNEEMEEKEEGVDDTFSQDKNSEEELDNNNEEGEEDSDNIKEKEEENISEEMLLKEELENVDFKSLLKAKAKIAYENSKKMKGIKDKKKYNKNSIIAQMEKINKDKKRIEPKEYSALLNPNIQFKNREKTQKNSSTLLNKKFLRDPRFDDLSGILNEEKFKKNFSFVNDMAKDYIDKLQKVKKSKKYKNKLTDQQYELIKKQNIYMKSWMNQQKQKQIKNDIKKEINKENKERYSKGQKPIFINDNKINKYIKSQKKDKNK